MTPEQKLELTLKLKKDLLIEAKSALMHYSTIMTSTNIRLAKLAATGTFSAEAEEISDLIFQLQRELVQNIDDIHDWETTFEYRLKKEIAKMKEIKNDNPRETIRNESLGKDITIN